MRYPTEGLDLLMPESENICRHDRTQSLQHIGNLILEILPACQSVLRVPCLSINSQYTICRNVNLFRSSHLFHSTSWSTPCNFLQHQTPGQHDRTRYRIPPPFPVNPSVRIQYANFGGVSACCLYHIQHHCKPLAFSAHWREHRKNDSHAHQTHRTCAAIRGQSRILAGCRYLNYAWEDV